MKILIMSAIFQVFTRSFTHIVSVVINSEHSLGTSIIQRLDVFHIQGFSFFLRGKLFCTKMSTPIHILCHMFFFNVIVLPFHQDMNLYLFFELECVFVTALNRIWWK